ncbi:ATP-binding Cassette (ABC) Superfamily [Phytophthora cinnamomi]|uniref:ATP-binding Cassette (ABC) Superfamily n=1 Tax=Phytophthora cinnamomi TaxID=4785 RepID=UPI00355AB318|nr:ATP-binding Cassette (ABC) Superfamily [Phytophthora cinnamomi]
MYGAPPPPPLDERAQLRQALERLQHEKGEADGMLQILRSKLHEVEEDNFDLHSNMAAFEAETRYESDKKAREMQAQLTALESKLSFMAAKLQNAERAKLRAINEVEELQQKQLLERKRRDAERRLMATKRRKHESFMASQSMMMMSQMQSQSQSQSQQLARPPPAPVVETAVQTELKLSEEAGKDGGNKLKEENSRLMSYLLTGTSRDLLTLLNGTVPVSVDEDAKPHREEDRTQPPQGCHSATPSQYFQGSSGNSFSDSMQQSPGAVPFSQSVFSQVAGRASAQAHASLVSFAMETKAAQTTLATDRARELYDVMGKMLAGDVSAVVLAPVFVKYLTAPTDLEVPVICSVLRVMYSVIHHSTHFQHFLLVASSPSDESSSTSGGPQRGANSMEHSRISLPGLRFTSLDDYVSARTSQGVEWDILQLFKHYCCSWLGWALEWCSRVKSHASSYLS